MVFFFLLCCASFVRRPSRKSGAASPPPWKCSSEGAASGRAGAVGDAVRAMDESAGAEKAGPENCGKLPLAIATSSRFYLRAERASSLGAVRSQRLMVQKIPVKTKTISPTKGKKAAHRLQMP